MNFDSEYRKLNDLQRQAVDSLEGPVMVIAGAGTGKTQTIALRIANILKKTDTRPSSVLCLTYTDVAAANMRSRLMGLIGPDANRVKIGTFHSFCNEIILGNPEYFAFASGLRPLDDLDAIEIVREIIDRLKDNSPLIAWGDRYYYQRAIIDNIRLLKREGLSLKLLTGLILDEEKFINGSAAVVEKLLTTRATKNNYPQIEAALDELIGSDFLSEYLKNYLSVVRQSSANLSEVKAKITGLYKDLQKNLPRQKEFIKIFKLYQSVLQKRGLYDYEDMILFVIKAFKDHPELLLAYQERYQYLLVDEYQDTNSAQNTILDLIGRFFDRPNIFVVGDDDQSIYRFQGASVENIYTFYRRYSPKIIVLKNNYRSHRLILEASGGVISRNQNRIAALIDNLDKTLTATVAYDPTPINLAPAPTAIDEDYFVANKISQLLKSGENPEEIAVLFRRNSDPLELIKMLDAFKIKYSLPSSTNILKNPLILETIALLKFIDNPQDSESLYHVLTAPFIRFNPLELTRITLKTSHLAPLLFNESKIAKLEITDRSKKKLNRLARRVARARTDLVNQPLERFFNRTLRRFRILKFLITRDDITSLSHLHTLSQHLNATLTSRELNLSGYLKRLNLYLVNHLSINSAALSAEKTDSVRLLTVHGAKGLEFNHVFLYRLLADTWEASRSNNNLLLPLGILKSTVTKEVEDDYEEDRRLFYVALTRAKKQIYLSYPETRDTGKSFTPSIFISEIDPEFMEKVPVTADPQSYRRYFSSPEPTLTPDLREYLHEFLRTGYRFNVTHLNAYLRCPVCFFYQTIIRIPYNKDKAASFGTAVHAALSGLYLKRFSREELLEVFTKALKRERLAKNDYFWCLKKGEAVLSAYFDQYQNSLAGNYLSEYNFFSDNLNLDGIPLTGRVDIIDRHDNGTVDLMDFKTGNPDQKYRELSENGDYHRQLTFYKLLLDLKHDPAMVFDHGFIDFVEPSPSKGIFVRPEIPVTDADIGNLKQQIKEVYQKILNLEFFDASPQCRDLNHLHYLLKIR